MRVVASLFIDLIWTLIRLLRPGGTRAVVAETLLVKHQLSILNRRNPAFGYQRIAHQLSLVLDIELDKDVVRRVLAKHYAPTPVIGAPPGCRFSGIPRTASGRSTSSDASR